MMGDRRSIVLTGFMGTGKTTVGQEVARRLGRPFIDMDRELESQWGRPIAEIFRTEGEAHFRRQERELCRALSRREGYVIATGGGALLEMEPRAWMARHFVVCLSAEPEVLAHRLGEDRHRPLVEGTDRLSRVRHWLALRQDAYRSFLHRLDTTHLSVEQASAQIVRRYRASQKMEGLLLRHPWGRSRVLMREGLFSDLGGVLLEEGLTGRPVVISDAVVGSLYGDMVREALVKEGFDPFLLEVPAGEASKSLATAELLYRRLAEERIDRQATLLGLGGGVIGDLVGFVAATYMRGLPLVLLPTTLLAMADASLGGKTALDHPEGKNLIGVFKPAQLVVVDPAILISLPRQEFAHGLAEIVKIALLKSPSLFAQLEAPDEKPLPPLLHEAIQLKARIVEEDPFEHGPRAMLNLGHTFAHALEMASGYRIPHGQAVSLGLVAATRLSSELGVLAPQVPARVEQVLERWGLPIRWESLDPDAVWEAMQIDKKRGGGRTRLVLLRDIGHPVVAENVPPGLVQEALESLKKERSHAPGGDLARTQPQSSGASRA